MKQAVRDALRPQALMRRSGVVVILLLALGLLSTAEGTQRPAVLEVVLKGPMRRSCGPSSVMKIFAVSTGLALRDGAAG